MKLLADLTIVKKLYLTVLVLFSSLLLASAQSLTISSTGQTSTSGATWSISGTTLTVTGTTNIQASVIQNALNNGHLTIVGNTTSLAVAINQVISSSAGNDLRIGGAGNTVGQVNINSNITNGGSITIDGGGIFQNTNVVLKTNVAGKSVTLNSTANIDFSSGNEINTNNGNVIINSDSDGNSSGNTWSSGLTINPGSGNVTFKSFYHREEYCVVNGTGVLTVESNTPGFFSAVWPQWFTPASTLTGLKIGNTTNNKDVWVYDQPLTINGPIELNGLGVYIQKNVTSTAPGAEIKFQASANVDVNNTVIVTSNNGKVSFIADSDATSGGNFYGAGLTVNPGSGDVLITSERIANEICAINGTGILTIEPSDDSFSDFSNLAPQTDWFTPAATLKGFKLGKANNTLNIYVRQPLIINGFIELSGGTIYVEQNITSTAAGNLFFNGNTNSWSFILSSGKKISKTAGYGLLTIQGNGRINNASSVGDIEATGTGKLDVILNAELDNDEVYGISTGNITTNGGHVYIGGGAKTFVWNGLSVGSKWSYGGGGGNAHGVDLSGNITTNGGHVLISARTASSAHSDIAALTSNRTISTGSGDVALLTRSNRFGTGSTLKINISSTGTFTMAPLNGIGTALGDLTISGTTSSGDFTGTDDAVGIVINNVANLGGLVFGTYLGTGLIGDTPYSIPNTSTANHTTTISSPITTNGRIVAYGLSVSASAALSSGGTGDAIQLIATSGNVAVNQNLTSTLSGAAILFQATGTIDLASSKTVESNAGNITFRANSGGTASSVTAINLYSSSSILSKGGNITIGGGFTGAQGAGLYAASTGAGMDLSGVTISAAGGNIKLYGKNTTSYNDGIRLRGTINTTGQGTIAIYGEAQGGVNASSEYFGGISFGVAGSSTIETENGSLVLSGLLTGAQNNNTAAINFYRSAAASGLSVNVISKKGNITITGDKGTTSANSFTLPSSGDVFFGSPSSGAWIASGNIVFNYDKLNSSSTNAFKVKTKGAVTYQPIANSFAESMTFPQHSAYVIAESASSLTIGKSTNTQNITFGSATSIAGPITAYGGKIAVDANLTSTATTGIGVSLNGQRITQKDGINVVTQGSNIEYLAINAPSYASTSNNFLIHLSPLATNKSTINANGGNINLSASFGTAGSGASSDRAIFTTFTDLITSGNGTISVTGDATNSISSGNNFGIQLKKTLIRTASGAITITGTGGKTGTSRGLFADGAPLNIVSNSGAITIVDKKPIGLTGTYNGMYLAPGSTDAVHNNIGADGTIVTSSSSPITIQTDKSNISLSGSGTIYGTKVNTSGAFVFEPVSNTFETEPTITGLSFLGNPSNVRIGKTTNTANITLGSPITSAGPISVYGDNIDVAADLNSSAGNGDILLQGNSTIEAVTANRTLKSGSGKISLITDQLIHTVTSQPKVIVETTGQFVFQPFNNSWPNYGGTFNFDGTLSNNNFLGATDAAGLGINNVSQLGGLVLGKPGNTGSIATSTDWTINGPITLYFANIGIGGKLTATNADINLHASGAVTQTAAITSNGLGLQGTGTFTLTNTSNSVSTIAGGSAITKIGSLNFINNKSLTVGSVNPTGITSTGAIELQTLSGDLLITEPINSSFASGDAIKLYADKDEVAGNTGDGNIKISGNGAITIASGARALLYSGMDGLSTGVTTAVGGATNTRTPYDATSNLTTLSPTINTTGKYALYRTVGNNADLSNLTVSTGTLSPVFASTTLVYNVTVPLNTTTFNFTPTQFVSGGGLTINGTNVTSGAAYSTTLSANSTTFTIVSKSVDGSITKTYTLRVLKQLTTVPVPTGEWVNLFTGARFDPNDDQQATSATDIVGNATNAMAQAQQSYASINGVVEKIYYFRVRLGDPIKNNTAPNTAFYYGLDVTQDQKIDLVVEANAKVSTPFVAYHIQDPTKDGSGPSMTAWLNSTTNNNVERKLTTAQSEIRAYPVTVQANTTVSTDMDANNATDTWLEFAFTESSFRSFTKDALKVEKSGSEVNGLVAFTSTSQTANGDIGGINDKTANMNLSWAQLGVILLSSLEDVTVPEVLDPLSVDVISTKSINGNATIYGVWNGDDYPNAVLTVKVFEPGTTTVKNTFVYNNATQAATGDISTTGFSWYINVTGYAPGLYPVQATMTDANANPTSAVGNGTLLVSRIQIDELLTDDTTPMFSGITDQGAGVVVTIEIKDANGTLLKTYTTTTNSDGTWSFTVPNTDALAIGNYELYAGIKVGTSESYDDAIIKIVDAPSIEITSALTYDFGSTQLSGISDQPANTDVDLVLTAPDGTNYTYTVKTDASGNWVFDLKTLPVGEYQIYVSVEDINGLRVADQRVLLVNKKALAVTGITANNKVYDGTTAATVTGTAALSGVVSGTTVTLSGTPIFTFASKNVADGISVTTSGYTLSGTDAVNYTLTQPTLSANITKAPLTITADDKSKGFGTADPALTVTYGATNANFVNGETSANLGGTLQISRVSGEIAGSYDITASGLISDNYAISFVKGTFTISAKNLSSADITIAALPNVVYKGDFYTPTPKVYDKGGELSSLNDFTYSYANNKNVGTATVTVTGKGNYTGTNSITFQITAAPLIVKAVDKSKEFGASEPTLTVSYSGFVGAENESTLGVVPIISRGSDQNVGVYTESILVSGVTLSNYSVTFQKGTFTITSKAINNSSSGITVEPVTSVVYNGANQTPKPVVKDGSTTLIEGTHYTLSYTDNKNVGTATIIITGIGNYSSTTTTTFSITKATLTVTAVNTSKSYGAADPTFTVTYSGFVGSPTETSAVLNGALSFARATGENVGTYVITPAGLESDNYTISYVNGSLTITAKPFSSSDINIATISNVVYNGLDQKQLPIVKDGGKVLVKETDYTVSYSTDTKNVGIVTLTITGTGNYTGPRTATYSITPAPLIITADDKSKLISQADPALTVSYSGFVNSETESVVTKPSPLATRAYGETSRTYTITAGTFSASNYSITYKTGTFSITGIDINSTTVSTLPDVIYKGAAYVDEPSITYNSATLVKGTHYTLTYSNNINVGTASVLITGIGEYVGYRTITFKINPIVITITPDASQTKVYGNTDPTLTYTASPASTISGETPSFTGALSRAAGESVNNYAINLGNLGLTDNGTFKASNYDIVLAATAVNFSITKAPLTVRVNDDSKFVTYTDNVANLNITPKFIGYAGVSISGFKFGETIANLDASGLQVIRKHIDGTSTPEEAAGQYNDVLTASGFLSVNYSFTYLPGDYTIVGADQLVIKVGNDSSIYGSAPVYQIESASYLSSSNQVIVDLKANSTIIGNKVTVTDGASGKAEFNIGILNNALSTAQKTKVGAYVLSPETGSIVTEGGLNFSNTLILQGNLTVTPKALTATVTGGTSKVYDGSALMNGLQLSVATKEGSDVVTASGTGTYNLGKDVGASKAFTVSGITLSGTDAANYYVNSSLTGTTGEITVKTLTVTPLPNQSKIYGTVDPTILYGFSGAVDGETPGFTGILKVNYAGQSFPESIGNYVIDQNTLVLADNSLFKAANYSLAYTTGVNFGVFNKDIASSSITVDAITSKVYNGAAQTFTVVVKDGASALTENTHYTVAFTNNINVGTATATITGKGDYSGSRTVTFQITPAPLTITANNATIIYDSADPGFTVAYNGFVGNPIETDAVVTKPSTLATREAGGNVGKYVITPGSFSASNYTITYATGLFEITKKDITSDANITITSIPDLVYSGVPQKPEPTVTDISFNTDDVLDLGTDYTLSYANNVIVGTASVTVSGIGNYSGTKTVSFNIIHKGLTITADNKAITFGETKPTLTATYSGFVNGETEADLKGVVLFPTISATNVGNYAIKLAYRTPRILFAGDNYDITFSDGSLTIGAKSITSTDITIDPVADVVYKGAAYAPTLTIKDGSTPLISGTDYDLSYGSNTNVGIATITITAKGNYTGTRTVNFNIKKAPLTIKAEDDAKIYGSADPTLTVDIIGLVNSEPLSTVTVGNITREKAGTSDGEKLGTYTITASEYSASNYAITYEPGTLAITSKLISGANVAAISDVNYTGLAHVPTPTVTDGSQQLTLNTDYILSYTNNTNVGTATVKISGIGGYSGSQSVTFKINPVPLTIKANNATKVYGSADPTFTVTYGATNADFVNGETSAVLAGTLDVSRAIGEDVANYTITASGLISSNYTITYAPGTFSITAKSITAAGITIDPIQNITYDGQTHSPVPVIKDGTKSLVKDTDFTLTYSANKNVGVVTITITGTGNYSGTTTTTFNIVPKGLTIKADDKTKVYGASDPDFTVSYDGFVTGESATDLSGTLGFTREPGENTGSYVITQSGLTSTNYTITYSTGSLIIGSKPISSIDITVSPVNDVTYNGTDHFPEISLKEGTYTLIQDKDYTLSYSNNKDAGTATITISGAGQYSASRTITFKINKAELTVSAENKSKMFGTADPALTVTYSGFVNGESASVLTGTLAITRVVGEDVGTYTISASGYSATNYTISYVPGILTIDLKSINNTETTVDPVADKIYNGQDHIPAPVVKDGSKLLVKDTDYTLGYSDNKNAGTATINILGKGNYSASKTLTFKILPATITVTPDAGKTKVYGSSDPELTYTFNGNITGETPLFEGTLSRAAGEPVGEYLIDKGSLTISDNAPFKAANYLISFVSGAKMNITKAPIVVKVNDDSKFVTQQDAGGYAGVRYEGFVFGEDRSVLDESGLKIVRSNAGVENAGEYANVLSASGVASANYSFTYETANYTIVGADQLLIKLGNSTTEYGIDPVYSIASASYLSSSNQQIVDLTKNTTVAGKAVTVNDGASGSAKFDIKIVSPLLSTSSRLSVGTYTLDAENIVETSPNFSNTLVVQGVLDVTPKELMLTVAGGKTKVYDGNDVMNDLQLSLVTPFATDVVSVSGTGVYADENANATKAYTISGMVLSGTDAPNYFVKGGATATLTANGTISPKALTVQADDKTKVYGSADPSLTVTYTGFVIGETSADLTGTLSIIRESGESVGTYDITASGLSSGNYDITYLPGLFTINAKSVSSNDIIVDLIADRVYNGQSQLPKPIVKDGSATLVEGTDYTLTYSDNTDTGNAVVTLTGIGEYSESRFINFMIKPATLLITPNSGLSKIYGGEDPELEFSFSGNISSETPGFDGSLSREDGEAVGNYAMSQGNLTLQDNGAFKASNYVIEFTPGIRMAINKATLSVIANNSNKFVTELDPSGFAGISYEGFVFGDTKSAVIESGLKINRTNSSVETAGTYADVLVASGLSSANYTFDYQPGDFTIVPAGQLVVKLRKSTTVYGTDPSYQVASAKYITSGNTIADLTSTTTVNGTVVTVTDGANGSATFDIAVQNAVNSTAAKLKVGTYTIQSSNVQVNTSNFSNTLVVEGLLEVTPKELTVSVTSDLSKVYDGTDVMKNLVLALATPFTSDVVSVSGKGSYANSTVSAIKSYTVSSMVLTGADAENYYVQGGASATVTGTGSITAKALVIDADDKSKVYGLSDPSFTVSYSGFVDGEDASDLDGSLVISRAVGENVGTYIITPTGLTSINYAISYTNGTLTIGAKSLTNSDIKLNAINDRVYTGKNQTPAPTIKDGLTSLVVNKDYTLVYANNKNVGTASITIAGTGNYSGSISQSFDITKAPLTISADNKIKTFGDEDPELTITYNGFVNDESDSDLGGSLDLGRTSGEDVGTYTITASGNTSSNYSISFVNGTFTIASKDLSDVDISVSKIDNRVYNGLAQNPKPIIKDGLETLLESTDYNLSYINNINVGSATITIKGIGNYSGTISKTFNITKSTLTITANDNSKTFGAIDPAFAVSYSGFVNNETASVLTNALAIKRTAGESVGDYVISPSGYSSSNYDINFVNGIFTIKAKGIDASDINAEVIADVVYKGTAYTPSPLIKDGEKILVEGVDYTITYANNTDAGTASIIIKGIGNYSGTRTINFNIAKAVLTVKADSKAKTVGAVDPVFTVSYAGFVLNENESVLGGSIQINRIAGEEIGNYIISISGLKSNNYEFDYQSGILSIGDVIKPTISVKNITVGLDANGKVAIKASDIDNGSFDAGGIASMTVAPSNFDCSNVGANTVTLTVTDASGNVSTMTAVVSVINNSPDTDGDGLKDNCDNDDGDGTPDDEDAFPKDPDEDKDSDGDGTGDNADTDDDGDGVNDDKDKCPNTAAGESVDANGCSTADKAKDTDGDGTPDVDDPDDDGDGVNDDKDKCADTPKGASVDANGCAESQKDTDKDGTPDDKDPDDDGDGTPDTKDVFPKDPDEDKDSDGDGTGDNADTDDDNDGVNDDKDLCPNTAAGASVDANGCSTADKEKDTDGDGTPDVSDPDDDGDGVNDDKDKCADTPKGLSVDANGCAESQKDTDADGIPDDKDPDDDGDGTPDTKDVFPKDPDEDKDSDGDGTGDNADTDDDNDGVNDDKDLCPNTANGESVDANGCSAADKEKDTDGDGTPDVNDPDDDGDGVNDDKDQCADTPKGASVDANGCADSQKDTDADGIPDDKDLDDDGDETPDTKDAFPKDPDEDKDSDGDGTGDNADTDDDNDGVNDDKDQCQGTASGETVDANGCSANDKEKDNDGNRLSDYYEAKNQAPSDVELSATSIAENSVIGTSIGQLSSLDAGDPYAHTYTLVSGAGDTNNANFEIVGNELKVKALFDFEKKSSYSVRIRTTDAGGLSVEKAFTITIKDVNEAPTSAMLSKQNIYEGNSIDDIIGLLSTTDQDGGDAHTYTLVTGAGSVDNASFKITNGELRAAQSFKYATKNEYSIRIRTTDKGGLSTEEQFMITISEKPTITGTGNETYPFTRTAASANPSISLGYSSNLNVSGSDIVSYKWTPSTGLSSTTISNPEAKPKATTTYFVEVTNRYGSKTTISITVTVREDYVITPGNMLTPNGDGVNDNWIIENLESYPNNKVTIFDRAGRLIYSKANYNNEWNGQLNGANLVEDTYYYIISIDGGKGEKKGFITIVR